MEMELGFGALTLDLETIKTQEVERLEREDWRSIGSLGAALSWPALKEKQGDGGGGLEVREMRVDALLLIEK